jgi:short-subunit dehydrogenase
MQHKNSTTALITGTSSGIGLELAIFLLKINAIWYWLHGTKKS